MRHTHDNSGTSGQGQSGSGTRANALWGKGKRRYSFMLAVAVLALAATAGASSPSTSAAPKSAAVPKELKKKAKDNPAETLSVIIQLADAGEEGTSDSTVDKAQKKKPGKAKGTKKKFKSLKTVAADVTGEQLEELAADENVIAISEDSEVRATGYGNSQDWAGSIDAQWGSVKKGTKFPTIAIVDSGVQSRSDFGSRLRKSINLYSGPGENSGRDGYGHGTMVAGLAGGEKAGYTGVEPRADIVSLDVLDNTGSGRVSDVLAACDWILENADRYEIRVANFSLNAGSGLGVADDPLNKAVEKLWLNGIVVVAAAGNYAQDGAESGVGFAPANDPFVITVGASDTNKTVSTDDDFAAPWSAWGFTQDGFRKPELAAPGRFMNAPVSKDAALYRSYPARKVDDGYMWMSGTSFAAPLVAGAAASILARNPDWTPDQVKGALMVGADVPTGYSSLGALGVGVLDVAKALAADGTANPNAALNQFVITDPNGLKAFDAATWTATAMADATWGAASWSSASWSSASWSSASWSSASWSSASWSSASWSSASWSSASWASNEAAE